MYPETTTIPPGDPHDVEAALERAQHDLPPPELERAVHHAEGVAEQAAEGELLRWGLLLVVGAVVFALAVHEVRWVLLTFLMMLLYVFPCVVAGISTAWSETEREDLTETLRARARRGAKA